jgi:hypothetical protein
MDRAQRHPCALHPHAFVFRRSERLSALRILWRPDSAPVMLVLRREAGGMMAYVWGLDVKPASDGRRCRVYKCTEIAYVMMFQNSSSIMFPPRWVSLCPAHSGLVRAGTPTSIKPYQW